MPNWCENRLYVRGERDRLADFQQKVAGDPLAYDTPQAKTALVLHFSSVRPTPPELLSADRKENPGVFPDWYTWRLENWGTKWDLTGVDVCAEIDDTSLTYYFETAWTPPSRWVEFVQKMWPDLKFRLEYYEPGIGFWGYLTKEGHERTADLGKTNPGMEDMPLWITESILLANETDEAIRNEDY